jgi:hypothetical protein
MRYSKWFAGLALAVGMTLPGAPALSADEPYWNGRDFRYERQDLRRDYDRVDRLRSHIAQDRARLNEDIRCGRDRAAARDAADLARDQRELDAQLRDVRHDRARFYSNRQYGWGYR